MLQKINPEVEEALNEAQSVSPVVQEKSLFEKENVRFSKALSIVENLRNSSESADFKDVNISYTDLEFLLTTIKLGQTRLTQLIAVGDAVNAKNDEIVKVLDQITRALPRVSIR
jgi:hypothetical protein